jgi:hypothetical protein
MDVPENLDTFLSDLLAEESSSVQLDADDRAFVDRICSARRRRSKQISTEPRPLHPLDGYLLDGTPAKAAAVAAALANRSTAAAAQPFYRALEIMGAKVADEALIALRVAMSGRVPGDAMIRTLRADVAAARTGDAAARARYFALLETA